MHDTGTVLYRCAPQSLQKLFIFLEFRAWIWLIIKEKLGKFNHFLCLLFLLPVISDCKQDRPTYNCNNNRSDVGKQAGQTDSDRRTDRQAVAFHYRRGRGIQRNNY